MNRLMVIRKYLIVLLVSSLICLSSITCSRNSVNDSNDTLDPSSIAIEGERFRVLGDFNCDGLEDMALSDEMSSFGTGGIGFTLFIRDEHNQLIECDRFGAKPWTISVECIGYDSRLWSYWHISAASGFLSYCEITDSGFINCQSMYINPGDGGSAIGNAIYSSVFDNSDVDLIIQRSITTDSIVEWIDDNK